jgi:2-polyprenyl-3-methyl-5-hydroxy-6-metoxy-1,4-benzoquinol methylase
MTMMDHSWSDNYRTPEPLKVRLDLVRHHTVSDDDDDAFGLAHLRREDMDGKSVVNVGCGTGVHDQEFLAQTGARPKRYLLADKSQAMVAEALERVRPLFPAVEHRAISLDELGPDLVGTFDLVVCMHVLYHVRDPAEAVQSLARLVADGGKLLITTVSHDNNRELLSLHNRVLQEQFGQAASPPTGWRFDTANAVDMVGRAFRDFRCHYRRAELRFASVDDAMAYYRSFAYFQEAIARAVAGDRLLESVRDGVIDAFTRHGHFGCNKSSLTLIATNPRTGRRKVGRSVPTSGERSQERP